MSELSTPASESLSKKHKKHKKHKHKKHRGGEDEEAPGGMTMEYSELATGEEEEDVDVDVDVTSPPIKLKIKLGRETLSMASLQQPGLQTGEDGVDIETWPEDQVRGEDVFITKKAGDDTSDEEREWLDALEAGTLDDSGALKKQRDLSLMTARQRARISGKPDEPMMQLPSGYKTTELTEEQLQRRQQKAKKRREQAMEKQEKDKKQTLDRLLKKQQSKMKGGKTRCGTRRSQVPAYRYVSNYLRTAIAVPQGHQFPLQAQTVKKPIPRTLCGVSGCKNKKKYNCSKSGVPLCSLECYKTNLATVMSVN